MQLRSTSSYNLNHLLMPRKHYNDTEVQETAKASSLIQRFYKHKKYDIKLIYNFNYMQHLHEQNNIV